MFDFREGLFSQTHAVSPIPRPQVLEIIAQQYNKQDKRPEYQHLSHDLGASAYNLLDGINQNLFDGKGKLRIEKNTYDKVAEPHKECVMSLSWRETHISIYISGDTYTAFIILNVNTTYGPEKVLELGNILPSWESWLTNAQEQFKTQLLPFLMPLL